MSKEIFFKASSTDRTEAATVRRQKQTRPASAVRRAFNTYEGRQHSGRLWRFCKMLDNGLKFDHVMAKAPRSLSLFWRKAQRRMRGFLDLGYRTGQHQPFPQGAIRVQLDGTAVPCKRSVSLQFSQPL
jgi:hypothetical protein